MFYFYQKSVLIYGGMNLKRILLMLGAMTLFFSSVFASTPWEFLRVPVEVAMVVSPIVLWVVGVISLGVMLVAFLALRKKSSRRLWFVSGAFALFFIKAILNLLDMYVSPGSFMNFAVQGIFDLCIIGALFLALFRK
jgi:hypothetical protein